MKGSADEADEFLRIRDELEDLSPDLDDELLDEVASIMVENL